MKQFRSLSANVGLQPARADLQSVQLLFFVERKTRILNPRH